MKKELTYFIPKMMREIRESLGLTQSELARLTGLSRQSINSYETGLAEPRLDSLSKWLEVITAKIRDKGK